MSDVANILGGIKDASAPTKPPPRPKGHHPSRAAQMTAVPKEMMDVVLGKQQDPDSAPLPPIVPTFASEDNNNDNNGVPQAQQTVKVGNKWINTQKPARKWIWAQFASSARNDGLLLNHWVRAEVEYPDYPYAKFDIHLDPISYTEEEYFGKLQHEDWTKSETDHLMELARIFELRWPVIYDRWFERYHYQVDVNQKNNSTEEEEEAKEGESKAEKDTPTQQKQQPAVAMVSRNIEDLQHRYYSVAAILMQHRIAEEAAAEVKALEGSTLDSTGMADPKAAADQLLRDTAVARTVAAGDPKHQPLIQNTGTGASNKIFDLAYEKERRLHLEKMWHRTKEEEEEEAQLRKELRLVETQLRKLKKAGGHLIAAADSTSKKAAAGAIAAAATTSAASSRDASRAASPAIEAPPAGGPEDDGQEVTSNAELLDKAFAYTAPVPTPGTPYLQSGRLAPPTVDGAMGLNKTTLARMDAVLAELKIPPRPLPTKRVCDLYDSVRKDALTLLTLQKMLLQKEGQLQAKRVKFAKMGGKIQVADEDTALGIPKPKPAPVATTPMAAAPSAAVAGTMASKAKGQRTGGKGKGASTGGGKGASKSAKTGSTAVSDPTKAAGTAKGKSSDTKGKGADAKSKASDAKPKAGSTPTAAAKTGTAGGGKQAPGAGKQAPTGKQAAGGKQTRKPTTKRKRKSEAKSPAAASAAAASAAASAPTLKAPPAAPVAAPVAGAPAPSKAETAGESKGGKKRARKS